jgi:cell division protein FtsZ
LFSEVVDLSSVEDVLDKIKEDEASTDKNSVERMIDEELEEILREAKARIVVLGCGGAGCNTVQRLMEVGVSGCTVSALNTDAQDLLYSQAHKKVLMGRGVTGGLGAGNDPTVGEEAARESEAEIKDMVTDVDLVFVTCGLGGGTGTGGSPVCADLAKKAGALTISVVTLPFTVEGQVRMQNARLGLEKLKEASDTVIVIPNDKLLELAPGLPINAAFKVSDETLMGAVMGITELINKPGLVNLDFADVRTVMRNGGVAMIGLGESDTDNRSVEAAEDALNSPLLDVDIGGATGALINIVAGPDVELQEVEKVVEMVSAKLSPDAQIIWGAQIDEELKSTMRVLVIISGVSSPYIVGKAAEKTPELELEEEEGEEVGKLRLEDLGISSL